MGRTHHDPNRLAAVAAASSHTLEDAKSRIRSGVAQSIATLARITPEQLATQAPSCNPKWGIKPASFIVDALLVKHLRDHCAQIRRNLAQFEEAHSSRT